jgi:hypothetical protein
MSPSEIEQYLLMEPMPTLRLTLASGDQIIVREEDEPFVSDLSLVLRGERSTRDMTSGSRLVSIPNICLAEPVDPRRPTGGRHRRLR